MDEREKMARKGEEKDLLFATLIETSNESRGGDVWMEEDAGWVWRVGYAVICEKGGIAVRIRG